MGKISKKKDATIRMIRVPRYVCERYTRRHQYELCEMVTHVNITRLICMQIQDIYMYTHICKICSQNGNWYTRIIWSKDISEVVCIIWVYDGWLVAWCNCFWNKTIVPFRTCICSIRMYLIKPVFNHLDICVQNKSEKRKQT